MKIEACIKDCMKRRVITVTSSTTVRQAARLVLEEHVGTLPVVDEAGVLLGVVRLHDILGVFMPDFLALLDNIDFVHDFGALEQAEPRLTPEIAQLTMSQLMGPAVAVEEDSGLMHALATLIKHQWQDIPIVDKRGRLVGIASRVDIALAYFAHWFRDEASG
jgi:CBS-domain-containing membrane protein